MQSTEPNYSKQKVLINVIYKLLDKKKQKKTNVKWPLIGLLLCI